MIRGQFFDKFLRLIEMNNEPVKWTKIDTSYLKKVKKKEVYYPQK